MTYEELVDKMEILYDVLDEFLMELRDNRNTINDNPSDKILRDPETIWQTVINDLHETIYKTGADA